VTTRRQLGTRGRAWVAGLSVGAAGILAAAMALTDHAADASPSRSARSPGVEDGGASFDPSARSAPALPYSPGESVGSGNSGASGASGATPVAPQPHSRTGGS
jgi:hypothetical protein